MTNETQRRALEEIAGYLNGFGRFIVEFSKAELSLYLVLVAMTGVSDAVARAIFSGVRAKGMSEYINAIIANTEGKEVSTKSKELQSVMMQLNAINTMRDQLVHHGVGSFTEEGLHLTNAPRVSRYDNVKEFSFPAVQLTNMASDLAQITAYLMSRAVNWKNPSAPAAVPPTTWLYKSPQPNNPQRRN